MRKFTIQFVLLFCAILETIFVFKIITSTSIIFKELYTGLSIIIMLTMVRLIYTLKDITYGDHKKN